MDDVDSFYIRRAADSISCVWRGISRVDLQRTSENFAESMVFVRRGIVMIVILEVHVTRMEWVGKT